jgi:hypothetical protein
MYLVRVPAREGQMNVIAVKGKCGRKLQKEIAEIREYE